MKNQKLIIIVIGAVILGLGGYLYFSGDIKKPSKNTTSSLVSTSTNQNPVSLNDSSNTTPTSSIKGTEIANLLKNINLIKLDDRVLSNPSFLALIDSSLILPSISVTGRANPFSRSAVLDSSTVNNTINTQTTTTTVTTPTTTTSPVVKTNTLPKSSR
jgi:hypothetical protein